MQQPYHNRFLPIRTRLPENSYDILILSTDINRPFETCGDDKERYTQTFMHCDTKGIYVYCMEYTTESQLASEKLQIHQYMVLPMR